MPNLEEWWKMPAFTPYFQGQSGGSKKDGYGYTGAGADQAIQPNRRVPGVGNGTYDGHEGEFVFDANATQAIGPDVLESIRQGAKSGQVDSNTLRQAIGQPQKQGMLGGGYVPYEIRSGKRPTSDLMIMQGQEAAANQPAARAADVSTPDPTAINRTNAASADYFTNKINTTDVARGGPTMDMVASSTPPPPPKPEAVNPFASIGPKIAGAVDYAKNLPKPQADTEEDTTLRDEAIDYKRGIMHGDNPYMENIANRYLQDIGGAGAAAYAGAKQEMARSGMGREAIAMGLATQRRDTSSDVARASGEMAAESMAQAAGAATELEAAGKWDIERADVEEEKNRGDFIGYVSTKIMTDPNYDWRNDQAAVNLAEGAWGADWETMASGATDGLRTSKSTAMVNSLKSDPNSFYSTAPSGGAGVYSIEQNGKTVITKEGYDEAFKQLAMIDTLGGIKISVTPDGLIELTDTTTGEGLEGQTTTTGEIDKSAEYKKFDLSYAGNDLSEPAFNAFIDEYGHVPTEDEWNNYSLSDRTYGAMDNQGNMIVTAKNVSSAVSVFTSEYDIPDVTTSGMKQYLETHDGKLPSAQEWATWSKSERTYNPEEGDDVAAAQIRLNNGVSSTMMAAYLTDNDGKLGDPAAFAEWAKTRTYGTSDDDIAMALTQLKDPPDVTYTRMTQYITANDGKIGTRAEFDTWNKATFDPEAGLEELSAANIPSGVFGTTGTSTWIDPQNLILGRDDISEAVDSGLYDDYIVDFSGKPRAQTYDYVMDGNVGKVVIDPKTGDKWLIIAGKSHFGYGNIGLMNLGTGTLENLGTEAGRKLLINLDNAPASA